MQKQQLVHVHGLLAAVRRHCVDAGLDIDCSRYDSLGTDESSLHRDKDAHRMAVFALAEAITTALDEEQAAVPAVRK